MNVDPNNGLQPGDGNDGARMVLFVAGEERNSLKARRNLDRLCKEQLKGRCTFEVVDVLTNYNQALRWKVLLTPALLVFASTPPVRITGNLDDTDRVLSALGMKGRGHGA